MRHQSRRVLLSCASFLTCHFSWVLCLLEKADKCITYFEAKAAMHRVRPTSTRLLSQAARSSHLNIAPRTCRGNIHHPTVTTSTQAQQTRALFNLFNKLTGRTPKNSSAAGAQAPKEPILSQDNLFHPLSRSPFPAVRARGETIANVAPCPVCTSEHSHSHASTASDSADPDQPHKHEEGQVKQKKKLAFECPDCGFPTHCSEEHWRADTEHDRYCSRLREVNEDEHDLRSGRRIREFEFPGTPPPLSSYTRIPNSDHKFCYYRRTGLRGSGLILQLGCLLVHPPVPLHGHRTRPPTRLQDLDVPADYREYPASVLRPHAVEPKAHT
jgi:hypothetical protein